MHSFFASMMGVFASIGTFFHGGHPPKQQITNTTTVNATASPSGTMQWKAHNDRMQLPQGEQPFFGTVTAVNGSTITLQMQRPFMMMHGQNISITPSLTPPAPKTITVTVNNSTTYVGGSLSDITANTKIAGIGKTNSDGSITAVKITINPTMPTGFPSGMPHHMMGFHHNEPQEQDNQE